MKDPIIWTGDEVINMSAQLSFNRLNMMKFRDIDQSIQRSITDNFPNYVDWVHKGVAAEVLQPGKDWRKGMLKLVVTYHVEFTPEAGTESQSPLDDLRSQLDTQSQ